MNKDPSFTVYTQPQSVQGCLRSMAIVITGFCFHYNYFPVYNNLQVQTIRNGTNTVIRAVLMASFILFMMGIIGLLMFGSSVKENVLHNVGLENGVGSQVILFIFMIVLICHCPYISFSHKEAILVMFDEMHRKSLSKAYRERVAELGGNTKTRS